MTKSNPLNATLGEALNAVATASDWPNIAAGLSMLKSVCRSDADKILAWSELADDSERPVDPTSLSLDDERWRTILAKVAESLHPDAGLAATVVVAAFLVTEGILARLKSLDITDSTLADISPLSELTGLESIQIDQSENMPGPLRDLSPLASLCNLSTVSLTCGVEDLTPIAHIPKLKELLLIYCDNVSDLSPLTDCRSLEKLCLDGCEQIHDVSPLARCENLRHVTLDSLLNVDNIECFSGFEGNLELEGMDHAEGAS